MWTIRPLHVLTVRLPDLAVRLPSPILVQNVAENARDYCCQLVFASYCRASSSPVTSRAERLGPNRHLLWRLFAIIAHDRHHLALRPTNYSNHQCRQIPVCLDLGHLISEAHLPGQTQRNGGPRQEREPCPPEMIFLAIFRALPNAIPTGASINDQAFAGRCPLPLIKVGWSGGI